MALLLGNDTVYKVFSMVSALGTCPDNNVYYSGKYTSFFSSNFSLLYFNFDKQKENQVEELQSIFIKHFTMFFLNQLFPEPSGSKSLQFPLQSDNDLLNVSELFASNSYLATITNVKLDLSFC